LTILFLLIEAILFGIFTSCMMFDQADVIRSKVTHIDRLGGGGGAADMVGGSLAGVLEVFGVAMSSRKDKFNADDDSDDDRNIFHNTRVRLDWFSPFVRVCLPSKDEVMGFCRPCCRPASNNATAANTGSRPSRGLPLADIV
jgi:hypothetical protein